MRGYVYQLLALNVFVRTALMTYALVFERGRRERRALGFQTAIHAGSPSDWAKNNGCVVLL